MILAHFWIWEDARVWAPLKLFLRSHPVWGQSPVFSILNHLRRTWVGSSGQWPDGGNFCSYWNGR